MKNLINSLLIIAIIGGTSYYIYALIKKSKTETKTLNQQTVLIGKNAININDQEEGTSIIVDLAILEKPGFAVIKIDKAGKPGKLIGASNLLQKGESRSISISGQFKINQNYLGMLYTDNGDGILDMVSDTRLRDGLGNEIEIKFTITEPGSTSPYYGY